MLLRKKLMFLEYGVHDSKSPNKNNPCTTCFFLIWGSILCSVRTDISGTGSYYWFSTTPPCTPLFYFTFIKEGKHIWRFTPKTKRLDLFLGVSWGFQSKTWFFLFLRFISLLKENELKSIAEVTGMGKGTQISFIIRLTCQFHLKWVARLLCLFRVSFSTPFCLRDLPLITSSVWDHCWSYLSKSSSVFHVHAVQQLQILWCC